MTTVSAPASIANLGPGFDLLAVAVSLRLEVEVEPSDRWMITSDGRPVGEETASVVREISGDDPRNVFIRSRIPVGKGLGSSAALRVAIAAAIASGEGSLDPGEVLRAATAAEGHPDNAAAAVFGGLVAVLGGGTILRLGVHPSLRLIVGVPDATMPTREARKAVPGSVTRSVAVRTAGRVAALIEGLRTADPHAFAAAAGDEMHEAPRGDLSPVTGRMVEAAGAAGALHAAWSGAGPSSVALATDSTVDAVAGALADVLGDEGHVLRLDVDRKGLEVA
ncbi:MAG TPA: homoserine kinase [Acidimicrobiia bacterium]|nr:homoserine kinase [Acidimicrobiia bacterium]